jgi:uncharacterized OB-fold protein
MSDARKIPAPTVSPETREFWEAAAAGRLLVKHCRACGEAHWYPRAHCPFCFGDATEWRESTGRGTIYSYSVMRRTATPFAIAYVTLNEGITMLTNIVDCDFDALRIGQSVEVVFRPTEGGPPVPMFRPA